MPRLRAFFAGVVLLTGLMMLADYLMQHHQSVVPAALQQRDLFYGWQPSEKSYLAPPQVATFSWKTPAGEQVLLRYDAAGFRVTDQEVKASENSQQISPPRFVCLGDRRVLAADLPVQKTFVFRWQEKRQQQAGPQNPEQARIVNAGCPTGCPLLWQLHSDRLQAYAGSHWLCFVGEETAFNDFQIRRNLQVDIQGRPIAAAHPQLGQNPAQEPTGQSAPFWEKQLVKLALPWLGDLFWGDDTRNQPTPGQENSLGNSGLVSSGNPASNSLVPCLALKISLQQAGGQLTLVYLPQLSELQEESRQPSPAAAGHSEGNLLTGAANSRLSFRQQVQDFARQYQITLLDFTPAFSAVSEPEKLYQPDSKMLSTAGHQLVAAQLERHYFGQLAEHQSGSTPSRNKLQSPESLTR